MIALLMALALQQAQAASTDPRPADLPALVTARVKDCVSEQTVHAASPVTHPPARLREDEALDGSRAHSRTEPGFCQITGLDWRAGGDAMARAVQSGLGHSSAPFAIVQWREPVATERGLSVWTTFEWKDSGDRTIAAVRLIEPADGTTGDLDIAYEAHRR